MPRPEQHNSSRLIPSRNPLWKGPEEDGITYSLLSRFLVCRERFRLLAVEGMRGARTFNHRVEYGMMWHICEEALAAGWSGSTGLRALTEYVQDLCRKHPTQQGQIRHWHDVCRTQFPIYVSYWSKNPDVLGRRSLFREKVFNVPHRLPSGRTVRLRGKWDSCDLIGKGRNVGVYLQENKTKGTIDEAQILRQMTFDLQTMMYLVALRIYQSDITDHAHKASDQVLSRQWPILGVRYNVVRRPLSGGRGSITRHKATAGARCKKCGGQGDRVISRVGIGGPCDKCAGTGRVGAKPEESKEEFYGRLAGLISEEPDAYFVRWKVEVCRADVDKFLWQCLDPMLESLCDWWEWIVCCGKRGIDPFYESRIHWRHPYGVWNVLDEGGHTDVDEYLFDGGTMGLERATTLFGELE